VVISAVPRAALVLAAGFGTRLRPLTLARAKPAFPVAGEPAIRRIIRWLASHQVNEVVLNLHHLPETVTAVVGDGSDLSVHARYSWEQPRILGNAGGPRQALAILGVETFFIANGDTLTDVDLARLAEAHDASGARVTLALVPNRARDLYSGVRLDHDGAVLGIVPRGSTEPSFHFVGAQIVQAGVFRSLAPGTPAQTIGGVYDELIRREPGAVRGFLSDAEFWDVGSLDEYWRTSLAFMRTEHTGDSVQGARTQVSTSARITRSILWDDVEVGADATLDECIVADRVRVLPGAIHRRQVLVRPKGSDALVVAPL
jgi:NDP-sugar pyrophosphorylase family protein